MIILGVDSSTSMGGAALVNQKQLLAEYILTIKRGHSQHLIPVIECLLKDAELDLKDITAFAVVTGPGSFTGIRVGLATVKGFAYALDKPIVAVTGMQALAWQYRNYPFLVCPVIDARRSQVFTQIFRGGEPVTEPVNWDIKALMAHLQNYNEKILFLGQGAVEYQEYLSQIENGTLATQEVLNLRPGSVAGLGLDLFRKGQTMDWQEVLPFYMRKSSAEYKI